MNLHECTTLKSALEEMPNRILLQRDFDFLYLLRLAEKEIDTLRERIDYLNNEYREVNDLRSRVRQLEEKNDRKTKMSN